MSKRNLKWEMRFMEMAELVSSWSSDPSTKVGAVIVKENRVLSQGYNGFPRGVDSIDIKTCDRKTKYKYIIHAETNAIYNALSNGISLQGSDLYCFGLFVCCECAKAIVQSGIERVFMPEHMSIGFSSEQRIDWEESFKLSQQIFDETGIEVVIL